MSKKDGVKKLIFIGQRGVGKTTLSQVLCGEEIRYQKTQTIQVKSHIIDTPGEFLERKVLNRSLLVSSYDADLVVMVEDATAEQMFFQPGLPSSRAFCLIIITAEARVQ